MRETDETKRLAGQPVLREKLAPARAQEYGEVVLGKLSRVVDSLTEENGVDGRIAVVGFCFGGTYAFALAAADPRVRAAVPFYGTAPDRGKVAGIRGSVLALYGEDDPPLIEQLPAVREAMADEGVDFSAHVYPGAGHAFFNDTNPRSYSPEVAADAWRRTLDFLDSALR